MVITRKNDISKTCEVTQLLRVMERKPRIVVYVQHAYYANLNLLNVYLTFLRLKLSQQLILTPNKLNAEITLKQSSCKRKSCNHRKSKKTSPTFKDPD